MELGRSTNDEERFLSEIFLRSEDFVLTSTILAKPSGLCQNRAKGVRAMPFRALPERPLIGSILQGPEGPEE